MVQGLACRSDAKREALDAFEARNVGEELPGEDEDLEAPFAAKLPTERHPIEVRPIRIGVDEGEVAGTSIVQLEGTREHRLRARGKDQIPADRQGGPIPPFRVLEDHHPIVSALSLEDFETLESGRYGLEHASEEERRRRTIALGQAKGDEELTPIVGDPNGKGDLASEEARRMDSPEEALESFVPTGIRNDFGTARGIRRIDLAGVRRIEGRGQMAQERGRGPRSIDGLSELPEMRREHAVPIESPVHEQGRVRWDDAPERVGDRGLPVAEGRGPLARAPHESPREKEDPGPDPLERKELHE